MKSFSKINENCEAFLASYGKASPIHIHIDLPDCLYISKRIRFREDESENPKIIELSVNYRENIVLE